MLGDRKKLLMSRVSASIFAPKITIPHGIKIESIMNSYAESTKDANVAVSGTVEKPQDATVGESQKWHISEVCGTSRIRQKLNR